MALNKDAGLASQNELVVEPERLKSCGQNSRADRSIDLSIR